MYEIEELKILKLIFYDDYFLFGCERQSFEIVCVHIA